MKVFVKWGKKVLEVDVDVSQPPLVFKSQLFTLTAVPPERQKVMAKGGRMLRDGDDDLSALDLREGQRLIMMGTPDVADSNGEAGVVGGMIKPPTKEIKFVEDLPEDEQDLAIDSWTSPGLVNLGNTCYMASTLQCLFNVEELRSLLKKYDPSAVSSAIQTQDSHRVVIAMKFIFDRLVSAKMPIEPEAFWTSLKKAFPQFAHQERGVYSQHDAEECWTNLMQCLSSRLSSNDEAKTLEDLFRIKYRAEVNCTESDESYFEDEDDWILKCHITSEINHLSQGIDGSLESTFEKQSEKLGRSTMWKKKAKISKLPDYITCQVQQQQKAKILRKVTFPATLDLFDNCTDELKEELRKGRKDEDQMDVRTDSKQPSDGGEKAEEDGSSKAKEDGMEIDSGPSDASTQHYPSGKLKLVAVLTHKGRTADSGHYVAWVLQGEKWIKYDDDYVSEVKEEEVLKLHGGGDWHMAYLCVYKKL